VPDGAGVPGLPLRVGKSTALAGHLDLDWGASCSTDAADHALYEGDIGRYFDHRAIVCTTGGAPAATIMPGTGDRYYLAVPIGAAVEGSAGATSTDAVRPWGAGVCASLRSVAACP
jgi:hypothetical protein